MTAAVVIGIVALILLSATAVAVTVIVSQALSRAFLALEQSQALSAQQLNKTLDRLMTIHWEDFVTTQEIESAEEGGFVSPAEQVEGEEDGGLEIPRPVWGLHTPAPTSDADVQALLDEDFPEPA